MTELQPPPTPTGNKNRFGLPNMSGNKGLIQPIIISAIMSLVIVGWISTSYNGGFVSKNDFTKNLGAMSTAVGQIQKDMTTTKGDVSKSLQTMPSIIDTNVNKTVTQTTSTWQTKLDTFMASVSKTQSDTATLLQGMAGTINSSITQTNALVANSIAQSNTQTDAKIKAVTDSITPLVARVSTLESNYQNVLKALSDQTSNNTASLAALTTKHTLDLNNLTVKELNDIASLNTSLQNQFVSLQTVNGNLQNSLATSQNQIIALQTQINSLTSMVITLQGQVALTQVSINTTPASFNLVSGLTSTIPILITNASNTALNVPLRLDLTTSGNVSIVSAVMGTPHTVTVNGANASFFTSLSLPANSSITFNLPVTLSYNGTNPNTWLASWGKQ